MSKSLSNLFTLILACAGCLVALSLTVEHYMPGFNPCGMVGGGCGGVINSDYGHLGPIPTAVFGLGMYLLLALLCLRRHRRLRELRAAEAASAAAYATSGAPSSAAPTVENLDGSAGEADSRPEPAEEPMLMVETPAAPSGASTAATALRHEIIRLDTAVWALALVGCGVSWWLQYTALFVILGFCPWCFVSAILITLIFILASRDHLLSGRQLSGEQKLLIGIAGFSLVLLAFLFYPYVAEQWYRVHHILVNGVDPNEHVGTEHRTKGEVIAPADMHIKGDPKAPYLLVEFADYQCPNCREAVSLVDRLLQERPHQVRIAFRNRPLVQLHRFALDAAYVAEAAALQGKFWEMHDTLYEHQDDMEKPNFSPSRFDDYARDVGLDMQQFAKDRTGSKVQNRVQQDMADADLLNANSTPTFFIITPKKYVWELTGAGELTKVVEDPNNGVWTGARPPSH
ncbi:MAG TPA: thioredoxin domain-containing protein [Chthonomonadaceae bacterium]|nr:thioredoxin domain-containing protein [Chthonomonadaceae bacterium]